MKTKRREKSRGKNTTIHGFTAWGMASSRTKGREFSSRKGGNEKGIPTDPENRRIKRTRKTADEYQYESG